MTEETVTPADTLGLLSSMYLCKPSVAAINGWKTALACDESIFLKELREAVIGINTESEQEVEALLWEYTRLFIGPYKLPCPPWESVYTSPKRLMLQDAADQVLQAYREAGLSISTPDVMPDHIGAELYFLALLLQKLHTETDRRELLLKTINNFMQAHIVRWVPEFSRDLKKSAETGFYKALGHITGNLVDFVGI